MLRETETIDCFLHRLREPVSRVRGLRGCIFRRFAWAENQFLRIKLRALIFFSVSLEGSGEERAE